MRWLSKTPTTLRRLYGIDKAKAIEFLDKHPVDAVLARGNIDRMGMGASHAVGLFDSRVDEITALAWDSGNLIPLGFDDEGLDLLADSLLDRGRICSSLVGPSAQILGLWERVESEWGPAREVRPRQYSMTIETPPLIAPDPGVRPARPEELSLVLPASIAMFMEEVGYDPMLYGNSYTHRANGLIQAGMTYIKLGPGLDGTGERVIFKADIGALAGGVAQIQGVWVAPDMRGRGIASAGMAAVVRQVHATFSPLVSLYVNDFNYAAVRVYQRVGFRVVGEWATVLL